MAVGRVSLTALFILAMCQVGAQGSLHAIRVRMVQGDVAGTDRMLDEALAAKDLSPVQRCRSLELRGEQFHRLSDIGEAKRYWDEALAIRQGSFGDSTVEAAVGYAYQARYHNYMVGSHFDHAGMARAMATSAKHLLRTRHGAVEDQERILILREYGYAFKVSEIIGGQDDHLRLSRTRSFYREALRAAISARDTIWIAQVTHDIGNAFNDEATRYSEELPSRDLYALVDSGLMYYRNSIALMTQAGFATSEAVMMDHFTMALLYRGALRSEGYAWAVRSFDEALRTMLRQCGGSAHVDPLAYDPRVTNPAQMVELLYIRASTCQLWAVEAPDADHLNEAVRSIEAAVPYWEEFIRECKSTEIGKVTGSYSHFPFRLGSELFFQRYKRDGREDDLHRSLLWSERNRNASGQRKELLAGLLPSALGENITLPTSLVAPQGSVVLIFNHATFQGVFVVDAQGLSVVGLDTIPADPDRSAGQFNEFPVGQHGLTPERFAREAHAWYERLLAPVLAHRDERELIIVPYGSLAMLPFESLCTSPVAKDWSEVAFVGERYSIRYARSIQEALTPNADCARSGAFIATATAEGFSSFPFASALLDRLHRELPGSMLERDFGSSDLNAAIASPGLFHLAIHGVNPSAPDKSPVLMLADGPWSATALDGARSNRTLAVLSTCSSGSGRNFQGEGVMSIAHAFLGAGTGSVVHALWPVDDQATSEILGGFYVGLDEGLSASEALKRAKMEFIARHRKDGLADPFYWSGIVLTGADVHLEERSEHMGVCIAACIMLLFGLGYLLAKRSKSSRERAAT